jgi:hypothetical protein
MRLLIALCSAALLSSFAIGQVVPGVTVYNGCGAPYIPRLTTPEVSLSTVSAAPVGASNATYGLVAGATDSTLSPGNVTGNLGGTYTQPVWYAGGTTPLISSPAVELSVPLAPLHMPGGNRREREHEVAEAARPTWIYYATEDETSSPVDASAASRTGRRATRTITNQDVEKQNQNNGSVKYDGKTEQIK